MIDGEIYIRTSTPIAIFAYRNNTELCSSLTHYACVMSDCVYIKGLNGSSGRIYTGETKLAREDEIEVFVNQLYRRGFHYNKANRRVIKILTGELI